MINGNCACTKWICYPSALLQLYLHSQLNKWFQWVGQRQLQTTRETFKFWNSFIITVCRIFHSRYRWSPEAIKANGGRGYGSKTRPDPRLAPKQWETSLQSNTVLHRLGTNLESVLPYHVECRSPVIKEMIFVQHDAWWLACSMNQSFTS